MQPPADQLTSAPDVTDSRETPAGGLHQRMVRVRNVAFVYQKKRKPYTTVCVFLEDAEPYYRASKIWKHTATINPAAWIEWLMNNPMERQQQIERLSI